MVILSTFDRFEGDWHLAEQIKLLPSRPAMNRGFRQKMHIITREDAKVFAQVHDFH